ncbi:uncharacterized protein BJ171DRAFT_493010 [Polychytrium aggregatum]|uniref:uncharacterized protein n=1 Tax=Polychytrium aggregatum TaxID=110093 RepID=UPI0022FE4AD5|nr:uncharacterized protein BJ171DRAFT_493010 [Polychytrium aggregatum]KAI9207554.1 hypothetical protein BJ171DRAFT_493010 [Polychytrium aggregatum]
MHWLHRLASSPLRATAASTWLPVRVVPCRPTCPNRTPTRNESGASIQTSRGLVQQLEDYLYLQNVTAAWNTYQALHETQQVDRISQHQYSHLLSIAASKTASDLDLFLTDMRRSLGKPPTDTDYEILLRSMARQGSLDRFEFYHAERTSLHGSNRAYELSYWNNRILALQRAGEAVEALQLYELDPQFTTAFLDPEAAIALLDACMSLGQFERVLALVERMQTSGLQPGTQVHRIAMEAAFELKNSKTVYNILERCRIRDRKSASYLYYVPLRAAYLLDRDLGQVEALLAKMQHSGYDPIKCVPSFVLKYWAQRRNYSMLFSLWKRLIPKREELYKTHHLRPDLPTELCGSPIVPELFARFLEMARGHDIKVNHILLLSLMDGYIKDGQLDSVRRILELALPLRIERIVWVFDSAVRAFLDQDPGRAMSVFLMMKENKIAGNFPLYQALIEHFCKTKDAAALAIVQGHLHTDVLALSASVHQKHYLIERLRIAFEGRQLELEQVIGSLASPSDRILWASQPSV